MFENAAGLAEGYYQENQREVGDNTAVMAGDISKKLMQVPIESREFQAYYYLPVLSRNLNESAIIEIGAANTGHTARAAGGRVGKVCGRTCSSRGPPDP